MPKIKDRKLLDEVRNFMRLHHYSIHTERTYCDWIKRFIQFHQMKSREDLLNGEKKNGAGSMFFLPVRLPLIREAVLFGAIISIPASSTKPSKLQYVKPG